MSERKMTERQSAVYKAIAELRKHGLQIGLLKCSPETLYDITSEYVTVSLLNVSEVTDHPADAPALSKKYLPHTYMGIPLEQKS